MSVKAEALALLASHGIALDGLLKESKLLCGASHCAECKNWTRLMHPDGRRVTVGVCELDGKYREQDYSCPRFAKKEDGKE